MILSGGTVPFPTDTQWDPLATWGTSGIDVLNGTDLTDHIYGLGGNDELSGFGGNDLLDGGEGSDRLEGGMGNDLLIVGGPGNQDDVAIGGGGTDTLSARNADDRAVVRLDRDHAGYIAAESMVGQDDVISGNGIENLEGSRFNDILIGDSMHNRLSGLAGDDYLRGGHGDDILIGGLGNDQLEGGEAFSEVDGDNALYGGDGNDDLHGYNGNDILVGGAGFDQLGGAGGSDRYTGGPDGDDFGVRNDDFIGTDEIFDFNPLEGDDLYLINFDGLDTVAEFKALADDTHNVGQGAAADTVITVSGTTLILYDVQEADLNSTNLYFYSPNDYDNLI
jgi:Ca2+-binding RTX toxin-like protein